MPRAKLLFVLVVTAGVLLGWYTLLPPHETLAGRGTSGSLPIDWAEIERLEQELERAQQVRRNDVKVGVTSATKRYAPMSRADLDREFGRFAAHARAVGTLASDDLRPAAGEGGN